MLKARFLTAMLLGGMLAAAMPFGTVSAQPARNIPPSAAMEHESMLAYLARLGHRTTPIGAATRHLAEVMEAHMALEDELSCRR